MLRGYRVRLLFITGLLATVTYLFVQSTALDPAQHLRTLQTMNALNRIDAELNRNVLLARNGLLLQYDPLNRAVGGLYRHLELLPFGNEVAAPKGFPDEIGRQFEAVRANVARKDELVERFKSSNALLRNSWAYFTDRSYALGQRNVARSGSDEVTATVGALSSAMLRVLKEPVGETRRAANVHLDRLEEVVVPANLTSSLESVMRHGRLILKLSPDLDSTLRELLTSRTGMLIDNLRNAYLEYHHRLQRNANKHRILLYGFSVLLLIYLVYLFYRLQAGARALSKVNEGLIGEIAERKHAEHEAHVLQTELAHVHRLSTMGEMATGLAHELNQPLAAITSYAQGCVQRLRSKKAKPEEMLDTMDKIAAEARRAGGIIRRVRSFVRKENPRWARIDANSAIRETADLLAAEAHRRGVAIKLDLVDPLPMVMADTIQIQQTVLNLMRNGIEAMDETGSAPPHLTIRTSKNGSDAILVTVEDNGHGIPPETLEHIFDPFFTTKESGLGLGLPICRSIVEAHGGRLWATSNAEDGTIFKLSLPIDDEGHHDNT
jgi:C4-dicarboxylate-specific signal transduction histidine kinase